MVEPVDVDEFLRDDLRALVSDATFSDTVLRGDDGELNAHMAFLQVRCPGLAQKASRQLACGFLIQMPGIVLQTLQHFLLYLYTDRIALDAGNDVAQTFALLQVAQGLYLSDKSDASVVASEACKRRRVDTSGCAMRRLFALCEQRIRELLTASTVIDILLRSVQLSSSSLENYVYDFLANTLPPHTKSVDFSRCLINAFGKEHQDVLARAISATAGNAQQAPGSARAEVPQVQPPCLLHHLEVLWQQTLHHEGDDRNDRLAKPDCKVILSGGSDSPPCQVQAHRFLLAARSRYYACVLSAPMKEAHTGELTIGVTPAPSAASVQALLNYLYIGSSALQVEEHGLTSTDLLDILSIVDGPGGKNYLQLSQEVCDLLRDQLMQQIKTNFRQDNMWNVLRRATAHRNEIIRKEAITAVLGRCQELCSDEVLFRCWGDCAWRSLEDWWTPHMENDLLREMLRLSCNTSSDIGYHDQWDLEVSHPAPEGTDNVFNQRGNRHLLQEWTDRGSACRYPGSISSTVVFTSVTVVPDHKSTWYCFRSFLAWPVAGGHLRKVSGR